MKVVKVEGRFEEIAKFKTGFGNIVRRALWLRRDDRGETEARNVIQGQFVGIGILGSDGRDTSSAVDVVEIVHYRVAHGSVEETVSEKINLYRCSCHPPFACAIV